MAKNDKVISFVGRTKKDKRQENADKAQFYADMDKMHELMKKSVERSYKSVRDYSPEGAFRFNQAMYFLDVLDGADFTKAQALKIMQDLTETVMELENIKDEMEADNENRGFAQAERAADGVSGGEVQDVQ